MEALSAILRNTLSSQSTVRRQSEADLLSFQQTDSSSFSQIILSLIVDANTDQSTRQSATLVFKNFVKRNWDEEANDDAAVAVHLSKETRDSIKSNLIPILFQLNLVPSLQIQLIESISIIASYDFPLDWQSLLDQLVAPMESPASYNDFVQNNSILSTAHSIFKRYVQLCRLHATHC